METIKGDLCQLLVDCLKKDEPGIGARLAGLSPERWQDFLKLARTQRVMPLLWHRIRQKGLTEAVPVNVAESLNKATSRNTLNNLRLYGELHRLIFALKTEGIPLILLKGIYLADAVYDNMGLREMNDIDVLARTTDLTRIADILTGMGYKPLKPIIADITLNATNHLPPLVRKGYAAFEIHWNLTPPGEIYSIDPDGLWERAVPVQVAECHALSLAPEDLLLHLCLHTSYIHQFAFGLRPSCDIAEAIARFGATLDWRILTERAVSWGWQRGVYLSLRLAKELAGAEVPSEILESLLPTDMTEDVMGTVRNQIFSDKSFALTVPAPFAALLESRSIWNKIRIFWQRVFLSKAIIAALYSIPMDSIRIYGCYPRRFVDVLRRHGHTLKKHQKNEAPLIALVERTSIIDRWLFFP